MNDRDLIYSTLFKANGDYSSRHDLTESRLAFVADAVLAAIGDRLIPELPDNVSWAYVEMFDDRPDSYSGPGYRTRVAAGTGPTIPTAIRNALESSPPSS